jgi:hypothetical protein
MPHSLIHQTVRPALYLPVTFFQGPQKNKNVALSLWLHPICLYVYFGVLPKRHMWSVFEISSIGFY